MSAKSDGERIAARLRELKEEARAATRVEVLRSATRIQASARQRVAVDRGGLRNSIAFRIEDEGMRAVIGTNSVYAMPTEFGRRPGSHPPVQPLIDWARRKGFDDPVGAAWSIAKRMQQFGTEPRPFLFPSFEEERAQFIDRMQEHYRNIARKLHA